MNDDLCAMLLHAIERAAHRGDTLRIEMIREIIQALAEEPSNGPLDDLADEPVSLVGKRNYDKAPFSWFGGKQYAAELVWQALGDVLHYVEPFAGSLAVLLRRPHLANRIQLSETINDLDGYVINAWRAITYAPDLTAAWASFPIAEHELMARHFWLLRWHREHADRIPASPEWYDARAAGYWLYGQSAWIGSGWCSGKGPWVIGAHGGVVRRSDRRDPGVMQKRIRVSDDGVGVQRSHLREPGVSRQRPHSSNNGVGVHRAHLREPKVVAANIAFHPMTMPQLRLWFRYLAARLRHVRMLNGDWRRAVTPAVIKTLYVRSGQGVAGVFLDPPYADRERKAGLYVHDDFAVAVDVRAWCLANGDDPQLRIVLAGFAGEGHEELERHGWRCIPWFREGFLRGGMALQAEAGHQQHRERLWLSPHCLPTSAEADDALRRLPLFADLASGVEEHDDADIGD